MIESFIRRSLLYVTFYRANFYMSIFNIFIKVFATTMLWQSLYASLGVTSYRGYVLSDIVVYSIASIGLAQTLSWWDGPQGEMLGHVRSGKIAIYLLRPMSYLSYMFYSTLGDYVVNFLFYTIPIMFLGFLVNGFSIEHCQQIVYFFVMICLSAVLLFLINFCIGLIAFITLDLRGILHLVHGVIFLLSGQFIPLTFYPSLLRGIVSILPFRYIFYYPLALLLGQEELTFKAVLLVVFWIVIVYGLVQLIWQKVSIRVNIQGG